MRTPTEHAPPHHCPLRAWNQRIRSDPASAARGIGNRISTMPDDAGNPARQASSPKSLSKVSMILSSRTAHANTSSSLLPGATVRTQTMSWPAASISATASPGIFSSARKRISCCARIHLFRSQHVTSISEASRKVVVRKTWIIAQNIGLIPAISHQANNEVDGEGR